MKQKRVTEIIILSALAILIILFVTYFSKEKDLTAEQIPELEARIPIFAYGIDIDSLVVFKDRIKKNQFVSDILQTYNVDYPTIDLMAKRSSNVFDVRKFRAGNYYSVICTNDTLQKVQYFIYENSPTSYVIYDLRDSIHAHMGEKDVTTSARTTSGIIESSLWNAMITNNTDPNLANELSEIYAWVIDFFGIQKGDYYKAVYDELFVEGESIGIGKVHAALFHHADNDYYAFYFVKDSTGDYFDDEANSMRRTFLKAPLRYRRISSGYSNSRLHPILKVRQPHHGVDYAADAGTPVQAVGDGIVIFARYKGANGNMVKIKHNGTYTTAYLHLSGFGKGIREGKSVKQGDVIGYVGSTGRSTGAHLDFRFYRNGQAINPLKVESPPAEPVDSTYLSEYNQLVNHYKIQLDSIAIENKTELAGMK
ncbi:MAG: peptidoglycan DD-metalloendopeptidase family protein [Bacteroidales bacterium]|nr:peptidoglycan DD-metalloendopeptidase family protein [Bacteroidales bacterium]